MTEMIWKTLILAAMVIWSASGLKTEDIFIKSYGVYFEYEGQIAASPVHWYHHFQVPLPTLSHFGPWYCSQNLDKIDKSHFRGCRRFVNVTEQASLIPYVNQINSDIEHHMHDFWETVNNSFSLKPEPEDQSHVTSTPTPTKPGYEDDFWYDYWYGSYYYDYDEDIQSEEWRRLTDEYESHKRLPNEGFNKIKTFLAENHDTLSYLERDAKVLTKTETRQKLKQIIGELYLYNQTQNYIRYISDVKNAILELNSGFLHPMLISDEQITEAVTKIKDELTKDGYGDNFQYAVPHYYRRFGSYVVLRDENSLWISLKMKIAPLMSLFRLHVYPAPVCSNSNDIIRITGLPDLIMYDDKQFASLTDTDLLFCSGTLVKECQLHIAFTNITANTCEAALIRGDIDFIYKNCDFRLYRNKLLPDFKILPNSSIIVYKVNRFNLTCNRHHTRTAIGCFFCIMEIPCGCRIELHGKMAYSYHSHTCPYRHWWHLPSQRFQNMAISKSFPDVNHFKFIYDEPYWNIKPLYRMYENDFDPYISAHQDVSYDLKLVAKAAVHNGTIYHSLAEAMASGRVKVPTKFSDTSGMFVMATLSLITSIITFLFSIVICFYYRRRTSAILIHSGEHDRRKTSLDSELHVSMIDEDDDPIYFNYMSH